MALTKINLDTFSSLIKETAVAAESGNFTDDFKTKAQQVINFVRFMDRQGVVLWDAAVRTCWCGKELRSAQEAKNHAAEAWKEPVITAEGYLRQLHLGEQQNREFVNVIIEALNAHEKRWREE